MLKDIFESRIDEVTYEPQFKICDKWLPITALVDAKLHFSESEYKQVITEEYGEDVYKEIIEKLG